MTEPKPGVAAAGSNIEDEMVVHKATRDCPMIEPHRRGICGIVQTRERLAREADARRRGTSPP